MSANLQYNNDEEHEDIYERSASLPDGEWSGLLGGLASTRGSISASKALKGGEALGIKSGLFARWHPGLVGGGGRCKPFPIERSSRRIAMCIGRGSI